MYVRMWVCLYSLNSFVFDSRHVYNKINKHVMYALPKPTRLGWYVGPVPVKLKVNATRDSTRHYASGIFWLSRPKMNEK